MDADDGLVVLNDHTVALPRLKLMVRSGRFNLEMNGVQEVSAAFDPLLEPGRLWMPESDSPYYIEPDRYRRMALIPFFSDQAKEVCSFGFSGRLAEWHESRTYVYSNPHYDAQMAVLFAQSLSNMLDDDPFRVLHLILTAIGELRDWPVPISARGEFDTMQICIGRSFVAAIEKETGLSFPPAGVEECILSEWRYEPDEESRITQM